MTAAEITPDVVQILKEEVSDLNTGSRTGLVTYFFKVTKANDGDWVVTATHFQSGTPIGFDAVTTDTNGVQEDTVGITFTLSGTLLTLSGGTTGVTHGRITFEEVA